MKRQIRVSVESSRVSPLLVRLSPAADAMGHAIPSFPAVGLGASALGNDDLGTVFWECPRKVRFRLYRRLFRDRREALRGMKGRAPRTSL